MISVTTACPYIKVHCRPVLGALFRKIKPERVIYFALIKTQKARDTANLTVLIANFNKPLIKFITL